MPDKTVPDPQLSIAKLQRELDEARAELGARNTAYSERIAYQAAANDVLKAMSISPGNPRPVFELISVRARDLCDAYGVTVYEFDGSLLHWRAATGVSDDKAERDAAKAAFPLPATPDLVAGRAILGRAIVHVRDYDRAPELRRFSLAVKSTVAVPLLRQGVPIGVLQMGNRERGGFSEAQVGLLETFADQAVIAIENAGLFNQLQARTSELSESLRQQTAVSDVLKTISRSTFDLRPVLDTLVATAARLCDAEMAFIMRREGNVYRAGAAVGYSPEYIAFLNSHPISPDRGTVTGRAVLERRAVQILDVVADPDYTLSEAVSLGGQRTALGVPLLRENDPVGALVLARQRVEPFTRKQIDLVITFADQAVIAIENVRLFNETKQALERQTAAAEVLGIISSSPGDLKPVFEQMLVKAMRLCEADCGFIYQMEQGAMRAVAEAGVPAAFAEYRRQNLHTGGAATPADVMRATRKPAHVHNAQESEAYRSGNPNAVAGVDLGGARTVLYVPMIKNEDIVGVINVYRQEVRPFTEEQISLLENFASQAVVAIENARLFNETRQALEQQTATSEVLSIISRSGGDLVPVFDAILGKAMQLCDANFGVLNTYDGHRFHTAATFGLPQAYDEYRRKQPLDYGPDTAPARLLKGERSVVIADLAKSKAYLDGERNRRALVELGGAQCVLAVPLLKDGRVVGNVMIFRQENRPFTEKQTALLEQFAAQAVIAIENTRLLSELRKRTADLSKSLDELQTAQDRLVQTEKLASLGQLTAGIAHEIKNPLNFVNNFAALSAELTAELKDALAPAPLDNKTRRDVDELTSMLKSNLEKVVQHGKRADSIVKNMLLHSREGSGEHRPADINALVEESLNLAYHGARAEKPQFNVTLQRDLDPRAGTVEVFPQEITRVLLNLISNGFHAVASRLATNSSGDFEPLVTACTRANEDQVEIRIRDNGTGIPPEVKEKIFNPFFTTKPAGEGTGLGLSIAHDIIVKQHGGRIEVTSEPQQFTEFVVILPRYGSNSRSGGAS